MTTNELKKGQMVHLRNGWKARIEDNKKGNIRMATVYGYCTEMGSVYSFDIVSYWDRAGNWLPVDHTPKQKSVRRWSKQCLENSQMIAYNVYLGRKLIYTIFYSDSYKITPNEVKSSLVNHDGYDPFIRVVKQRKKKGTK